MRITFEVCFVLVINYVGLTNKSTAVIDSISVLFLPMFVAGSFFRCSVQRFNLFFVVRRLPSSNSGRSKTGIAWKEAFSYLPSKPANVVIREACVKIA